MVRKSRKILVLAAALVMAILGAGGVGTAAQAGERIFGVSHSSADKELWGNRGIAPKGYIVGGLPAELDTTHTVVKGECLWDIAGYSNIYGNSAKWSLIYKANKDNIKNPHRIYPGQVLKIPR